MVSPEQHGPERRGRVEHSDVMDWAAETFGGATAGQIPSSTEAQPALPKERVIVEGREVAQCNMGIGLRAIGREDPDRFALTILTNLLGRGMSSRLFKEVRERRGLADPVGASTSRYSGVGSFSISAGVSPENVVEATKVILSELRRLIDEPVGADELTKARDYTAGSFRLGLESTMSLGQRNGDSLLNMGRIEPVEEVVDRFQSVTAAEVQRVAKRIFFTENLAMAVVGPGAESDDFRLALEIERQELRAMGDRAELKSLAWRAIDNRRDEIIGVAREIFANPEPGFREQGTAERVGRKIDEWGSPPRRQLRSPVSKAG